MDSYILSRELFYALTAALLLFFAMEGIKPNIVQTYIPLNGVLLLWLAAGIVSTWLKANSSN